MFKLLPESQGDLLAFEASGRLTDDDYQEELIPRVEAVLQAHGKARLLVRFGDDFQGWDLGGLWDDAKWGLKHRNDFRKLAVVGGPQWFDWAIKVDRLIMDGEVKTFPDEELGQAWAWIKA